MTQQQAYEELRARLNKLFPERLELKFGCEMYNDTHGLVRAFGNRVSSSIYKKDKCEFYFLYEYEKGYSDRHMWGAAKDFKILGTPITLQEILRALYTKMAQAEIIVLSKQDGAWVDLTVELLLKYDFTNPVSEQSLETLQWLLEVIPENK